MTDFPGQLENETRADFCHPKAVRIDTPTNKNLRNIMRNISQTSWDFVLLVHHVQSCDVLQRYYSSAYRLLQYFGTFTTQPPECQRKLPHKLRVPASGSSSRRKILLLTIAVFFSIPLVWYFSLGKCIIFHLIWRQISSSKAC